ncbi:MAG: triose-phosphate isomerase [Pseudomonadota bacterium]
MLIAGNWKMHGRRTDTGWPARFAEMPRPAHVDVLLCPPATLLAALGPGLGATGVSLGAQDCSAHTDGAHTGDLSAGMLADLGCSHVIVGHSERRTDHGEHDALVRAKAEAALNAGLTPIVCVGETLAQRDAGVAEAIVSEQVRVSRPAAGRYIIAYEPVWAIGTGRSASLEDIALMHAAVRRAAGEAELSVLYGGSVKPDNAASILSLEGVDGALVGGASLDPDEFAAIVAATA